MSKQVTVSPWTQQQCQQSCTSQKTQCLTQNIGNPSPPRAYAIQQCHTNYNICVTRCRTNNIRPYR